MEEKLGAATFGHVMAIGVNNEGWSLSELLALTK